MIDYVTISLPYPTWEFWKIFFTYWVIQSTLCIPLTITIIKIVLKEKYTKRYSKSEIESIKKVAWYFCVSPLGLIFTLLALKARFK